MVVIAATLLHAVMVLAVLADFPETRRAIVELVPAMVVAAVVHQ